MRSKETKFDFRIIKDTLNKKVTYSIHKVEYDSLGIPISMHFHPVILTLYEKKDLKKELILIQNAFKNIILEKKDIKYIIG